MNGKIVIKEFGTGKYRAKKTWVDGTRRLENLARDY
jgi:hypothetical protein